MAIHERQKPPDASVVGLRFDMLRKIRPVLDEPLHAVLEPRQAVHQIGVQRFHGEERNEAHH